MVFENNLTPTLGVIPINDRYSDRINIGPRVASRLSGPCNNARISPRPYNLVLLDKIPQQILILETIINILIPLR